MNEESIIRNDSELLTPEMICGLLADKQLVYETKDSSLIEIHKDNAIYLIFTNELPWLKISRPATVRNTRDIVILKKAIDLYDINMVKCRLIDNKQGGYVIEAYIDTLEPLFDHFKDTIDTFFFLLDRAFKDINDLYEKIQQEEKPVEKPPKGFVPAEKKYSIRKNGKIFFWTYLVQIAVLSLPVFVYTLVAIVNPYFSPHAAFSRIPWLWYSVLAGSAIAFLMAVAAIILYVKKNKKWISLTVVLSLSISWFFILMTTWLAITGPRFSFFDFRYSLFMAIINLAYLAFLIKYKVNATRGGEILNGKFAYYFDKAKNPTIAKVLFSIAAYGLCIAIGCTCAIVVPAKTMSIIGAVCAGIIAFFIIYIIFGNVDDKEEYIEE